MSVMSAPAPTVRSPSTAEAPRPPEVAARRRRGYWPQRTFWLLSSFVLYIVVGALLAFHYQSFNGDAQARTANAYYVLFSRDPHLGAIGFVWNPLTSMSVLPLLLFSHLWRPLAERAFAGNIVSAAFMAGAVVQLRGILSDCKVRRSIAFLIVALFALNPMIVYYGGNGMSEGLYLFTLVAATRYLMRYLKSGATAALVRSGIWLGVAYYARNEAVAAVGFGVLVVLISSYRRVIAERRARLRVAIVDGFILGLPSLFAFVTWAAASWLIVGHPFEQFTSQYGTSSQLQVMQQSGAKLGGNSGFALQMALLMAPTVLLTGAVCALRALGAVRAKRTGDFQFLGALAILGGGLTFAIAAFAEGQTAGWFRYFITGVPLTAVLAGLCFANTARPLARTGRAAAAGMSQTFGALAAAAALVAPSLVTTGLAMSNPRIGREEYTHLSVVFHGSPDIATEETGRYPRSVALARHFDALHLPDGSIVVDTFTPCVPFMVLASRHATQFIITNDRDFKPVVADPATFKARYLLVPAPVGIGVLDALNRAYPDLYSTGASIATRVDEFSGPGCPTFRLYAVK